MFSPLTRRLIARCIFIIGLLLMFLGSAFLLGTITGASWISVLRAFFFVILGSGCAVLAIKLNKRSLYLFFAGFFMLLGFFLFLSALKIIPVSFSQAWPLISVFSGFALIPAGWHRYGAFRSRYVVPGIAFIILGSVLLIFSFNMVPFSFAHFMMQWWPLLVVLTGLLLVLISLGSKPPVEDTSQNKES
ncbi:MAG: DUF5668 domain-containing protein [Spirochaetaceae bacterium]|jgi:hypothetical protein|nr:DUF5668 domain-containing protein [Spirochaetaceae bacterium]